MKKSKLALLFLPALLLVGCGDEEEIPNEKDVPLLKSKTSYDADGMPNEKEIYEYNDKGLNTVYLTQYYDEESSKFVNEQKNVITYDESGKMLSDEFMQFDENGENPSVLMKTTYEYSNNLLTKEKAYYSHEGQLYLTDYFSDYLYDDVGRVLSVKHYRLKEEFDTEMYLHFLKTFEYIGSLTEASEVTTKFYYEDGSLKETENSFTEYDDKGRKLYFISDNPINLDEQYSIFYSYDEKGNVVSEGSYDIDAEGVFTITSLTDYYYEGGLEKEITITNFDDDGHPIELKLIEENYNEDRTISKVTYKTYDSIEGEFVVSSYTVYEY